MSSLLLIVVGVALVVMVLVLTVGRGPGGRRPPRSVSGMAERENAAAAQFDVEEHDIEEMIEARNALRRRIGKPPIGDELADEARGEPSDQSER
jgi:hypothetical protein